MENTLQTIKQLYDGDEGRMLVKAYAYAENAHANQKRASGEPYFIHPCAVADILMELGLDAATIAAALLHDVIEDTDSTEEDIKREFGAEVLALVSGVTKLEKIEFKSKEDADAENFRKIFVAMAKDVRVIIIKLADRLHNMRSLNFLSHERQQRMASETLEIYAPLAGRLGISQIKCELEDLCLKYLDPESYEYLLYNIRERLSERKEFVAQIVEEIKQLMEHDGVEGEVFGRPKHFYSIYKKMKNKYFCKKVSERIKPSKQGKIVVACDKFNIVAHHDNTFHLYLDKNFIANWSYQNDEVTDLSIISEELFNSFKEKYPRI